MENSKQQKFKTIVKVGLVAAVGLIVAPVVFLVIQGVVGLIVAGALGMTAMALVPALSERLTQLKFQAMKTVISRAPVETLHQRAKERWEELAEQRNILHAQAAALAAFKQKAAKFNIAYPEEAPQINEQLEGYERLFAHRVDLFKKAKEDTNKFMSVVEKAEAIYEMAVADAELGKSFNKGKDFMAIYREKTAFDAIDKANATALANLKMALVDDDYTTKQIQQTQQPIRSITYDNNSMPITGNILDVSSVKVPALSFKEAA